MSQPSILWIDDEIDLLKPHRLFLEEKGYQVTPYHDGIAALEWLSKNSCDLVFLDENMPGISGLMLIEKIHWIKKGVPIVMVTNNSEEHIMNEAIGASITDYLIKPVLPQQMLAVLKKHLDTKKLVQAHQSQAFHGKYQQLADQMPQLHDHQSWSVWYLSLIELECQLDEHSDQTLSELLAQLKKQANRFFGDFLSERYPTWLAQEASPLRTDLVLRKEVLPHINQPTILLVLDNLRYDHWLSLEQLCASWYEKSEETVVWSTLPTATAYARNALCAGLVPRLIAKNHPDLWLNEWDTSGKNLAEAELISRLIRDMGLSPKWSYHKVQNQKQGLSLVQKIPQWAKQDLTVIVYNTLDKISHAKTDNDLAKELIVDDRSYRALLRTWFTHSPLSKILEVSAQHRMKLMITTDHGSIQVGHPIHLKSDKNINANLRYKVGKSIKAHPKEALNIHEPEKYGLPSLGTNHQYIIAKNDGFFTYPQQEHEHIHHYRQTYQHGGMTMEEVLVPFAVLMPKSIN